MSNIKGLTDLPSFEPFENINQPGDEKSIKSAEEADHKASTYGHRGILLTDKKTNSLIILKLKFSHFLGKKLMNSKKNFLIQSQKVKKNST
ncbi:MAG: hypothetical protein HWD61_05310 [Parachlamydiaceae bacterium]|nr:MAG: hypothetical protein HWD61_05310 [Parachlamydiaceae bacterium]